MEQHQINKNNCAGHAKEIPGLQKLAKTCVEHLGEMFVMTPRWDCCGLSDVTREFYQALVKAYEMGRAAGSEPPIPQTERVENC